MLISGIFLRRKSDLDLQSKYHPHQSIFHNIQPQSSCPTAVVSEPPRPSVVTSFGYSFLGNQQQ